MKKQSSLSKFFEFFIGKRPRIFNDQGIAEHDLGKNTWEKYQMKYKTDPSYNWKNHMGHTTKNNKIVATDTQDS